MTAASATTSAAGPNAIAPTAPARRVPSTGRARPGYPVIAVASVLLSLLSLLVLPHGLAYDPWSWLVWGREVLHLRLDTTGDATSMKPLPLAITTAAALFGGAAPLVWLFVARAAAIAGVMIAFRVAARFSGPVAGAVAAVGTMAIAQYSSYLFVTGMSEPMAVACALAAVDAAMDRRHGRALLALLATALLRIEAWPFLFLYLLVLLWRHRSWRRLIGSAALLLVLPLAWFGTDWLGSRQLLRSADAASHQSLGGPLLTAHPGLATIEETVHLLLAPLAVAFVATVLGCLVVIWRSSQETAVRRARELLVVAACAVGWVAVAAAMAEARIATGAIRYLLPAAGLAVVVGAVGVVEAVRLVGRAAARQTSSRHAAGAAAGLAALALLAGAVPQLATTARRVDGEIPADQQLKQLAADIHRVVGRAGGVQALGCGRIGTAPYQVPTVAWVLNLPLDQITDRAPTVGSVLQVGGGPVVPAARRSAYRIVATAGQPGSQWRLLTTCPRPGSGSAG